MKLLIYEKRTSSCLWKYPKLFPTAGIQREKFHIVSFCLWNTSSKRPGYQAYLCPGWHDRTTGSSPLMYSHHNRKCSNTFDAITWPFCRQWLPGPSCRSRRLWPPDLQLQQLHPHQLASQKEEQSSLPAYRSRPDTQKLLAGNHISGHMCRYSNMY